MFLPLNDVHACYAVLAQGIYFLLLTFSGQGATNCAHGTAPAEGVRGRAGAERDAGMHRSRLARPLHRVGQTPGGATAAAQGSDLG